MGAVSEAAVQAALAVQPQQGGRLGEILGRMGSLDDTRLAEALARQAGLPTISPDELAGLQVPLKLLNALPEAYASAKRILPIAHDAVARCVTLAAADPHDRTTINEARILIAAPAVEVRVAPRGSLEETIRRVYASRGVETVGEGGALLLLATASQNVADSLKVRLVAEGFTVRHVVDGQLAREALEQGGVSGLVCELSLPKVDGYNLLLTARSRDAYRDLPIFVFSSRADDYHMSKALELGADDFLPMPLNLDFLVSKLRRSVVKRPAADASAALAPPAGGVAGSLAEMSLTEIVQTLELGRKTATVAIQFTGGVSGVIGFVSGQVTYAKADDQVGEPAFYVLAAPHEGSFQIRYGEVQAEKNIDNSTTFLLLEAMRRTDERR
jgi:DNA-binding response OmpR family regulator